MVNKRQRQPITNKEQGYAASPSAKELRDRIFERNIEKRLVITPMIDIDTRIQKHTITISLGTKFIVMRGIKYAAISPLEVTEDKVEGILEKIELEFNQEIVLRPNHMLLAGSFEYISMPNDLWANVGPRSTYGRLALVPATATLIHPGFKGCLTLELVNVGADAIVVCPRMEVAQLVFQYCSEDPEPLITKYKMPIGPEFPKVWADTNLRKLLKFRKTIRRPH